MPRKRTTDARAKRARKAFSYHPNAKPSVRSAYGRKRRYLDANGGFGFDYPAPKPWK